MATLKRHGNDETVMYSANDQEKAAQTVLLELHWTLGKGNLLHQIWDSQMPTVK